MPYPDSLCTARLKRSILLFTTMLCAVVHQTSFGQSTNDLLAIGSRRYQRSEFKVNSGAFEVNQRANLALLSTRNFIVAWHEGAPNDAYGRVFDPQGNTVCNLFSLHPFGSSGWQYGPSPAGLANGGVVAAWGGDFSYAGVQKFTLSCAAAGGEASLVSSHAWPALASHSSGEFVVAFGTADAAVQARRFSSDMSAGNLFQVGAFVSGWFHPSVAYGPDGRFTIAWPAAGNIRARTYTSNEFSAVGPEFVVNTTNAAQCYYASIAYNSSNELLVAWSGSGPEDTAGVFARRFAAGGVPTGIEFLINDATNGSQAVPNVSIGSNDDIFVAWQTAGDVYGRLFNSAGVPMSGQFRINKATSGTQQITSHAGMHGNLILDNTNIVVGWAGDGPAGPGVYVTMLQFLYDAEIRITNQPANVETTLGGTASFRVGAASAESLSYQWQFNATNVEDATNATVTLNNVQSSQAGGYRCVISNSLVVRTSAVATLSVLQYARCCGQLYEMGYRTNGLFVIDPDGPGGEGSISVECLMTLSGGGWAKLTAPVASSAVNTDTNKFREYLYVQNSTARWYRSPVSRLVWDWNSGKDLYGVYSYSTGGPESTFTVRPSGERQRYGVGGSSGPGGTFKCLIFYNDCKNAATAQIQLCQDRPGIFGSACQCGVTVYIRECVASNVWPLQLTATPANGGTLAGAAVFPNGISATISAEPNVGYRFAYWIGDGVADTNSPVTTVLMTQPRSVTGLFVKTWILAVNAEPARSGRVYGEGTHDNGALATIRAEPATASRFLRWEGDGIADPTLEITTVLMDTNRTVTAYFTAPDLVATNIVVPSGAIAGQLIQASWTVTNQGTAAAIGTWTDRIWLSSGDQVGEDGEARLYPIEGSVFVNGSIMRVQNVPLPAHLSGEHWLVVEVNFDGGVAELNHSNNFAISPHPILITNLPCPNLQLHAVFAPSNVFAGQETVIEWAVTNAGPVSTGSAQWRDAVYLSIDRVYDAGDTLLCTVSNHSALNSHESYFSRCTVQIPPRIQGTRYAIVRTDYQNRVNECGLDSDNIGVSGPIDVKIGPYPDLQVTRVIGPFEGFDGDAVDITWAVTNAGTGPTQESFWDDTIYYSTNETFSPNRALASFPHSGVLATGQTYTVTRQVVLPIGVTNTNFHFFVLTDSRDDVWEYVFENNNAGRTTRATDVHLTPPPDLEVCAVSVPAIAHANAGLAITYCVTNRGANATPNHSWQDAFYLSTDTNLNTLDDRYLGSATHHGALQRNEGYQSAVTITIPANLNGIRYLIVRTDSGNTIFELNKTNNEGASSATVNILGLADLQPVSLTIPPSALAGFDFTVAYRVTNSGPCPTIGSNWTDTFYLSADQALNTAIDRPVGTANHSGQLDIGGAYQGNATLKAPIGLSGNHYLLVVTDNDNHLQEQNEANNSLISAPIQLQLASNDLAVAAIGLPSEAVAGFNVTFTYVITNRGLHSIPNTSWRDAFYLSSDGTLRTNNFLGEATHNGSVEPGQSYTNTAMFRLADGLSGDFGLFVVSDSRTEVFELDESNNVALSSTTMRVVTIPPDLVVATCAAASNAVSGTAVPVSWTVRNIGPGRTTTDAWRDAVVLSTDMTYGNSDDRLIGEVPNPGALDPLASYVSDQFVSIPRSTPAGVYYVFVQTDWRADAYEGPNDGNNFCLANSILITRPDVDLVVTTVAATNEAYSGQTFTVAYTVQNLGNTAATGGWRDYIYLSRIPEVTTNAFLVGTNIRTAPLAPGATYTVSNTVTLPWDVAGDFYVIVTADGADSLIESREDNNAKATTTPTYIYLSPTPDLTVTLVAPSANALSGQPARISWSILNAGAATEQRWFDSAYLSLDTIFDRNSDIFLDFVEHTGLLDEATSYTVDRLFDIPPGLYGSFHLFVVADSRNHIYERGGEANNIAYAAAPMTITVPPLSDLILTSVSAPTGPIYVGATGTVSYTVLNQSQSPINGRWEDTIYLSSDQTWDVDDALFARVNVARNLGAWESYIETISARIPGVIPGSYHLIVRTDIRNHIAEADDGNNHGVSSSAMATDMIELQLGIPYETNLFESDDHYYFVNTPAGEVLSITLDSTATNGSHELFTRFAQVPTRAQWDEVGSNPFSPDQQIIVPETEVGTYYNLVHGQSVPVSPAEYRIAAALVPFGLESVSPNRIGDNGQVTLTLRGARFEAGAMVQLRNATANVFASYTSVIDSTMVKARFSLTDFEHGIFDLVISLPGGEMAVLNDAVIVETATGFVPEIVGNAELFPRVGSTFHFTGLARNIGNVDIPYLFVGAYINQSYELIMLPPSDAVPQQDLLSRPSNAFIIQDLEPGNSRLFNFTVHGFNQPFVYLAIGAAYSASEYSNLLANASVEPLTKLAKSGLLAAGLHRCVPDTDACFREFMREMFRCFLRPGRPGGTPDCITDAYKKFNMCILPENCDPPECGTQASGGATGTACPRQPIDPNEKLGPPGIGESRFVAAQALSYAVYFENLPEASAAPREIRIIDKLGAGLDSRSVRLGEIVFGKYRVSVPGNRSFYQTRLQLDAENGNVLADITAFVDVQAREIRWTLRAINPATGELPESAQVGLLLPNDSTHRGEGFVSYTIQSVDGLASGTVLTNSATIVFDSTEPFDTTLVWNTLDPGAPSSSITSAPRVAFGNFPLSWEGIDDVGGSGLQSFDIFVSDNGGPYQVWLSGTTSTSASYAGQPEHTYCFYVRARDNVGNVEAALGAPDACVRVTALCPIPDQIAPVGRTLLVTNCTSDPDLPVIWALTEGPSDIKLANGIISWTPKCSHGSTTNMVTVVARDAVASNVTATQSFRIIVPECVEVGLSNTVVRAGEQGCVAIDLFSSVDLTELSFALEFPSNRFSAFTLTHALPGSTGIVEGVTTTSAVIHLIPPAGQYFRGPLRIGELCFSNTVGLPSDFVFLSPNDVVGRKPDGPEVANAFGVAGRVVVVADRPLLEAFRGTNATERCFIIYAPMPTTNVLQYVTDITDTNWQDRGWEVIQSNLMQRFNATDTNSPPVYFRARQK